MVAAEATGMAPPRSAHPSRADATRPDVYPATLVDARVRALFDIVAALSVRDLGRRLTLPPPDDPFYHLMVGLNLTLEDLEGQTETEGRKRERELIDHATRLEDLNARLEDANERLDAFAYTVSHDMKEPLRGIRVGAEALREDLGEDKRFHEDLDRIVRSAERLREMLDVVLQLSRKGRADVPLEPVDLKECAEAAVQNLATALEESGGKVDLPATMPTILAHRIEFDEVFTNLFSNALKFNDTAEPLVRVEVVDDDDSWCVNVSDNGPGIPPLMLERVFELFRRAGRQEKAGHGAGLTIVRRIVEAHGGRVWATSREGDGATFVLRLPKHGPDAPSGSTLTATP